MKKLILTLAFLLIASTGFTAPVDIAQDEVRANSKGYVFYEFTCQKDYCRSIYNRVDANDIVIEKEVTYFMDVEDDPNTTEIDETDNSFTQLVDTLNLKTVVTNATKSKMGIE